jgi:DNA-binding NtrC family response regulator
VRIQQAYLNQGTELQLGNTKVVFCPVQQTRVYELSPKQDFGALLGKSIAMRRIFYIAERYAPTDVTILIEGETGTGKEVLAEEIHRHSPRSDKPFVVVDCASLAKDIIESELFGHMKGAFTGATTDRTGAFEYATGGTIFLDEIGNLSSDLQPKLLRVLEKREIKRVGSNKLINTNVRIICATNRKLDVEVNAGRFREDLYFRLSVLHIDMPPLRRRKEDLPLLTNKFLKDLLGNEAASRISDFKKAMEAFGNHDWPGNVRELRNVVEMACSGARGPVDLGAFLYFGRVKGDAGGQNRAYSAERPFKEAKGDLIADFEKSYIQDLLRRSDGNVSKASREAGIERAYLQRLIKKYELGS